MTALLDTHVMLWFATGDRRLSVMARNLLGALDNEIYLSAVSAAEISIKFARGKLRTEGTPASLVREIMTDLHLLALPVSMEHALKMADLPTHHYDPFDRLLIAQAQAEQLPIISSDRMFRRYDVQIIW